MYFAGALRSFGRAAMGCAVCFGATAHADPVPVIEVSVGGADSFATLRAHVVTALGPDALADNTLARRIEARFGRAVPSSDDLAPSRAEVTAAVDAYFARGGPRESRRRLDAAINALEQNRLALEARPENLAALLRALTMRARIALEARESSDATSLLARVVQNDPTWSPDPHEFPPTVVRAHRIVREAAQRAPQSEISVETPDDACTSTLDGRSPTRGRHAAWSADTGRHRIVVRCESFTSRAHPPSASLRVDPRVDAVVDSAGSVARLVYASADEARARADADAASLARALDARRVVLLDSDGLRVIDAASGRSLGALPPSRAAEVTTLLSETPPATSVVARETPSPQTFSQDAGPRPQPSSSRVAPVAVIVAGGAATVVGAVFLGMYLYELGRIEALCPGSVDCPAERFDEASGHRTSAVTDQYVAIAGLAVGAAAIGAGALWYALSPRGSSATNTAPRVTAAASLTSASIVLRGTF